MTLALSTSSPLVSVAVFGDDWRLLAQDETEAPRAASGAVIRMTLGSLTSLGLHLQDVRRIVVDVGPGSFTGVKVGLSITKTWGYALGVPVAGVTSFDLVSASGAVALPSKKGEFFFRDEDGAVSIVPGESLSAAQGYGFPGGDLRPHAAKADPARRVFADPMALEGFYVAEPSISQAKRAHIMGETFG